MIVTLLIGATVGAIVMALFKSAPSEDTERLDFIASNQLSLMHKPSGGCAVLRNADGGPVVIARGEDARMVLDAAEAVLYPEF